MKAISSQVTIGTVTAKNDGSLRFSVYTPELKDEEKVAVMQLQNQVLEMMLKPIEGEITDAVIVATPKDEKSASERLRNTIYALWASKKEAGEYVDEQFQQYYQRIMESFIEKVKEQLEDYE